MKTIQILPFTAAFALCLSAAALAQNGTTPQGTMVEKPASLQQGNASGTAPEHKGSTGWTGGSGSDLGQSPSKSSAEGQPEMATGADLKGPPERFPAGNTPE